MVQHDSRVQMDMEDIENIDGARGQRRGGTVRYRSGMAPSRENPVRYMNGEAQPRREPEQYGEEAAVFGRNSVRNGNGSAQLRRRPEEYGEEAAVPQRNPVRGGNGAVQPRRRPAQYEEEATIPQSPQRNPVRAGNGEQQLRRRSEEYGEEATIPQSPQRNPVRGGNGAVQPRRRPAQYEEEALNSRENPVGYGNDSVITQSNVPEKQNLRRNPYLEDYARQRSQAQSRKRPRTAGDASFFDLIAPRRGRTAGESSGRTVRSGARQTSPNSGSRAIQEGAGRAVQRVESRAVQEGAGRAVQRVEGRAIQESAGRTSQGGVRRTTVRAGVSDCTMADIVARRAAQYLRRKHILLQRIAIVLWVLFIGVTTIYFLDRHDRAAAGDRRGNGVQAGAGMGQAGDGNPLSGSDLVQGIPADEFAKHPDWTEDLLTPNEYSRPGDPLESVTNIFVHYTANAGTSAAQNRSYFEQQKDTHKNSVSAHFIIGYEGEILQCIPLDEIAYAVKSRNFDSISIECCFLEKDGSFTEATYDSLISLLAWLIDVYDLDSEDILRHYDCGGKKCPLYYTEHPEAWTQLKKDVDKL